MSHPLVSVIIPTYNRTEYLKLTLESVKNQSFKDFEIIVVDDGTLTNDNEALCNELGGIKYLKIKNSGGPAKPRNKGISLAKGKYIAFVDDDDLWYPDKLQIQTDILEYNPDYGLVHSCCEVIDENGKHMKTIIGRPGNIGVKQGDVKLKMMGNWTLMTPTPLLRKSIVKQVGFFNENIPTAGEDREYWTRCSFFTKFYYIDQPLAFYRKHSNNISTDNKDYFNLPIYLKLSLETVRLQVDISKQDYGILINNLLFMQAKKIKNNFTNTILNLFKLDKFWFLNFRIFKTILVTYLK